MLSAAKQLILILLPLALIFSTCVYAEQAGSPERVPYGFDAGLEYFTWEEFDANGASILKETGPRFTFGGYLGNMLIQDRGFMYHVDARIYVGIVDYEGRDSNQVAFNTDTDYTGMALEGLAGYRLGSGTVRADFIGAAVIDAWRRYINGGTNVNGGSVSALEEYYGIVNLKLGGGPSFHTQTWRGQLHLGVKYPVLTDEYAQLTEIGFEDDAQLSPNGRASGFLSFTNQFALSADRALSIDVYYDSYRFAPSEMQIIFDGTQNKAVWQPESHMDVFGIQAGVRF